MNIRKDNELLAEALKGMLPKFIARWIWKKPKPSTLNIRELI